MIALSEETLKRIAALFPGESASVVADFLLRECGDNLPLVQPDSVLLVERIRFAVIRLSAGDRGELSRHVAAAKTDWRDVLMAAGFGENIAVHLQWNP